MKTTAGTHLINRDVPQEVVRRILDHDLHQMTAHYARLSDATIRRHWERARKVDIHGGTVVLDPDGPARRGRLGQAAAQPGSPSPAQRLLRAAPGPAVPARQRLTCPLFITTAEFLPGHRCQQQQQTLQIISAAQARGQARMAEMNQQVADSLQRIITALEAGQDPQEDAADVC